MPTGYIPRADGSFDAWQDNFLDYATAHALELGLTPEAVAKLNAARADWRQAHEGHVAARAAARSARQAKVDRRADYDRLIREAVRQIQTRSATTDGQRAGLGITVPDRQPTTVGPPTTRPVVRVDFSKRLRHRIAYADQKTPTRRARPRGVTGVEIWVRVAAPGEAPPSGPGELRFVRFSTRTPAVVEYGGDDAGRTAHYMLRWLSSRAQPGPWSETASATIGA